MTGNRTLLSDWGLGPTILRIWGVDLICPTSTFLPHSSATNVLHGTLALLIVGLEKCMPSDSAGEMCTFTRCELSPTRTLKWPGRWAQSRSNHVSATHRALLSYNMYYVPRGTKGQLSWLQEFVYFFFFLFVLFCFAFCLFWVFFFAEPWTDGVEETEVPGEYSWRWALENVTY